MQRVIGRVGRAHGIRGEVNVDIRTDEPSRRFAPGTSVIAGEVTLTVRSARQHGARMVVGFTEVTDRDAAESLRATILQVNVDVLDMPDNPDEYYDHQLIGLQARTAGGDTVGVIHEVLHLPAQDTLVVRAGDREVLIPFVQALVPQVAIGDGFLTVNDQPGLIDPGAAEEAGRH